MSVYTVQETANYFAGRLRRIAQDQHDSQRLTAGEWVSFGSIEAFLHRIATDDLDVFTAAVVGDAPVPEKEGKR